MKTEEKMFKAIWQEAINLGFQLNESDAHSIALAIKPIWKEYAEKENAELLKLLGVAKCPNCDGNGAIQVAEDDWEQCQWCYERNEKIQR
jgi:hypothetical protein